MAPLEQDVTVFVRDPATGRYRLAGEYGGPGPVPSPLLPALRLEWADVFPALVR